MEEDGWPASRRYVVGSMLNWAFYLGGLGLLVWAEGAGFLTPLLGWTLVLLIAGSVLGQFLVAYRSIARRDEFVRALTFKRGIAAAGISISLAVLWGFADQFLGFPAIPMWIIYPLFWGVFGIVSPFIRSTQA